MKKGDLVTKTDVKDKLFFVGEYIGETFLDLISVDDLKPCCGIVDETKIVIEKQQITYKEKTFIWFGSKYWCISPEPITRYSYEINNVRYYIEINQAEMPDCSFSYGIMTNLLLDSEQTWPYPGMCDLNVKSKEKADYEIYLLKDLYKKLENSKYFTDQKYKGLKEHLFTFSQPQLKLF